MIRVEVSVTLSDGLAGSEVWRTQRAIEERLRDANRLSERIVGVASRVVIDLGDPRQTEILREAALPITLDGSSLFPPTSAEEWLTSCWKDLMNGAGPAEFAYVRGAIDALWQTNAISIEQAELWRRRIVTCPDNRSDDPGHVGGRAWCAYCGDIPVAEQGALRQPIDPDDEPASETVAMPDLIVDGDTLAERS